MFKPNRDISIILNLVGQGNNYKKKLVKLLSLQNACKIAISYKIDLDYVYLSFDNTILKQNFYKTKKDRVIAVDLNPNYLGYSVVDWKTEISYTIIDSGVFDLSELNNYEKSLKVSSNDKKKLYCKNKRDYEIIKIAHRLSELAKHFKCETFSIEDLSIHTVDHDRGRNLNRLINNQWNRNKFVSVLKKLVNASSTTLVEVKPEYSSILGNLIYIAERLPDMVLSSIELGRRAYEFQNQYLLNMKTRKKNIILPNLELVKNRIAQSLEELNNSIQFENYSELFSELKKSKLKYRFLLDSVEKSRVLSKNYSKNYVKLYNFI